MLRAPRLLKSPPARAVLVLGALFLVVPEARAQVCQGDITLTTQAQVDAFDCTEVTGDLRVGIMFVPNTDIDNLDSLNGLTTVGGQLLVLYNDALTDVDGLSTLIAVGSLWIGGNDALTSLAGLAGITAVGGSLRIEGNAALTNVDGLAGLSSVGGELRISSNAALTNVDGLATLTAVGGDLRVIENGSLGACTTGLAPLLSGGNIGGDIVLYGNLPECNHVCVILEECGVATEDDPEGLVTELAPLHPNPVRGAATLTYTLAAPASVTLTVYDALGRLVQTLAEGERPAGAHAVAWASEALPAGVYVVRLAAGGEAWTQRVTLVR